MTVTMNIKQIILYLNCECLLFTIVHMIWIFATEFIFYRVITNHFLHQKECEKQYTKHELSRLSENRRQAQQDSQNPSMGILAIIKILSFTFLSVIIYIDPNGFISNTEVISASGLLAVSFTWCMLRYFNILHAEPDKRRWRLRHTNQLGPGLAHNYWDGFLQNLVRDNDRHVGEYPRKGVSFKERTDFTSVIDVISKFEDEHSDWRKIPQNLKKLVILVDYSCNFKKDKSTWPQFYKMERREDENDNMPSLEPINPIKMSSKSRPFKINIARVWNPNDENDFFHIVYDCVDILRSGMGGSKNRVNDPEQKRRNVDDFLLYLRKMLKRHEVTERVEIITFNDETMTQDNQLSIYEIIKAHFGDNENELFQFNSYVQEKCY